MREFEQNGTNDEDFMTLTRIKKQSFLSAWGFKMILEDHIFPSMTTRHSIGSGGSFLFYSRQNKKNRIS